jgi:competence protein ComEC
LWNGKKFQVYIEKSEKAEKLRTGDMLMVYMKPQELQSAKNAKGFDYSDWLRKKGICATAYVSSVSWKLYSKASRFDLVAEAEQARSKLLNRYKNANISGEEFSLVSALTLGSTNLLTSETKHQFSVSGVSHILSVSGLHVGAIYAVLELLFSLFNRFNKLKMIKQILIVLSLWSYAFMTGLSPSVIRSTLMFSLIIGGSCLHRKTQTINTVLFSAFLLLLWKPSFLFDLSFELSYCAVIAIVLVHAHFTALLNPSSRVIRYLWEMICLSTVAQLGTAPLTIYYFHQFPNYFLLNNLVAVPASALIIYLAVAFLFLFDLPVLGGMLSWSLKESLHLFQKFVETMSDMPFALTQNLEIQKTQVFVLYLLMGAIFIWLFMKRRSWIFIVLLSVLLLQGLSLSHYLRFQKRSNLCEMYVNSYICKKGIHDYKNYCRRSDRPGQAPFKAIKQCGYRIPPKS